MNLSLDGGRKQRSFNRRLRACFRKKSESWELQWFEVASTALSESILWSHLARSPSLEECKIPFRYFNSSPGIIRLAVMMYVRFPLSLRQVEDLLCERGIDICHETVRL